ncbi:MAG: ATP-binding cassette domain-containing protein, partial [Syntrophothermus sp.]
MIDLINISVQFSGDYLFRDVNVKINAGDKISLVGANGTGKTTLLKVICGIIQPESGRIQLQKNISTGYLPQEFVVHSGKRLFDEVRSSLQIINDLQTEEFSLTENLNSPSLSEAERDKYVHRLGEVHHRMEEVGYYSINSEI